MDAKRQLHENHALRRLYNSHPLAANRSLIKMNEHSSCSSIQSPFQSHVKESPTNDRVKEVMLLRETGMNQIPGYDAYTLDSIELQKSASFKSQETLYQFRKKLHTSKRNMRNQNLINSLRAGVYSAPLLNESKNKKDQFLRYRNPSRVSSISVSKLQIQEKNEDQSKTVLLNSHRQQNAKIAATKSGKSTIYDNVSLPEISISNNDSDSIQLASPQALMFGRWGYRNRKDKKRKIPNCWMEKYNESLTIRSTVINDFPHPSPRVNQLRKGTGTFLKTSDLIKACKAQNSNENKDIPVVPTATPTFSREETIESSNATAENPKVNVKLEILINPSSKNMGEQKSGEIEGEHALKSPSFSSEKPTTDIELAAATTGQSGIAKEKKEEDKNNENAKDEVIDQQADCNYNRIEDTDEKSKL